MKYVEMKIKMIFVIKTSFNKNLIIFHVILKLEESGQTRQKNNASKPNTLELKDFISDNNLKLWHMKKKKMNNKPIRKSV